MLQQHIQAWFMELPLWGKAIVVGIVGAIIGGYYLVKQMGIEPEELLAWLPVAGVLLVAAAIGGVFAWRWWEKQQVLKQMALNKELAQAATVRLLLPPRGTNDSWKKVSERAAWFAGSLSTVLRQFPDRHIALEIVGTEQGIVFQVWTPEAMFQSVLQEILAVYEDVQVRYPKDVMKMPDMLHALDAQTQWVLFKLAQKPHYPLREVGEFNAEALASILAALVRSPGMGRIGLQLVLKAPRSEKWATAGLQEVERRRVAMAQVKGTRPAEKQRVDAMGRKADAMTGIAATLVAFAEPGSADRLNRLATAISSITRSRYNALDVAAQGQGTERILERHFDPKAGNATILSAEELSPLWHIPQPAGDILTARGVFLPAPPEVTVIDRIPFHRNHRILGRSRMRTGEEVYVKWEHSTRFDTLVHSFICGPTGVGKSTLIASLIIQDILAGYGAILMEPHRDLTLAVLAGIPPERLGDVIWINPVDPQRSFGLNLMDYGGNPAHRDAAAASLMAALQKIVGGDWSVAVRMKRLIENSVNALLEAEPLPTMLHLLAFFRHEEYRAGCVERVTNPVVKEFWVSDYGNWPAKEQASAMGPVLNRVEPLLAKDLTRHVVAQATTTLPLLELVNAGKILLIDLSAKDKGIGKANAEALGALVVNLVWGAISSRVKGTYPIPSYFWIDEFQNYITEEIVDILAEARGFGLGLNLATQYYSRLPQWMQQAVLSNCRTKITGTVDNPDEARLMTKIFVGVDEAKIRSLEAFTYLARVSAQRRASDSFTLMGLPPVKPARNGKKGDKAIDPARLRRAFMKTNGGQLPMPQANGAIAFDPFAGLDLMDEDEALTWKQHQAAMEGLDRLGRAHYLAGLSEDSWQEYRFIRRKADLGEYRALIENPDLVPGDVPLPEEVARELGPGTVRRVMRIRRLSSLQVETPRDEIEAERLRLDKTAQSATAEVEDLLSML